jgi:ubiquinone/menaquinone biosynthesis C-methylase UbiE
MEKMAMNFFDEKNKHSYTTRSVNEIWIATIKSLVDAAGKNAADIGCGGGIYSRALREIGAYVTGVDFSKEMLKGARENCAGIDGITFQEGNALQTGLEDQGYDIVLERALIHHLYANQLKECFQEAYRVLKSEGIVMIQDRTPEDCLKPGSSVHIRGYFFEQFPFLAEQETKRRHDSHTVKEALFAAGFQDVQEMKLWETRKIYGSAAELRSDLAGRTGRSILHELSDEQLASLIDYIIGMVKKTRKGVIEEKDCWTIWYAVKK